MKLKKKNFCNICDKSYKSENSFYMHKYRFHKELLKKKQNNEDKNKGNPFKCNIHNINTKFKNSIGKYACEYCNQLYSYRQGRYKHQLSCNLNPNNIEKKINEIYNNSNNNDDSNNIMKQIEFEILKLKIQNNKLESKINKLESKINKKK